MKSRKIWKTVLIALGCALGAWAFGALLLPVLLPFFIGLAVSLLSEKPVLIFDEPTSGLDYARMVEVSGVIRDLARQGRIVLVVTHDQEFLQQACDRVLHL